MTMKQTLYAWLQSAFLKIVTPTTKPPRPVDVFIPFFTIVPPIISDPWSLVFSQPIFDEAKPSKEVQEIFNLIKKFNKDTDLLVISSENLEKALAFDEDGQLHALIPRMLILGKELFNTAIVCTGYRTGFF